jgi:threonine dehydrogenase-like Zn-dependent dehydrogenase
MRALVFDGQRLRVVDRPAPIAREGQVIVRPARAGVCNTDLEIVRGYMGFEGTLGHELVGTVDSGPDEWRGKRVTCEINFACGNCDQCTRSMGRHCPTRTVMGILGQDGAFAEQVAVPIANLHELPDAIDDDEAVFVEPLAAAFEIREQLQVDSSCEALVLGDGKLGMLVAQVLRAAGANVLAVGKHADHLAVLYDRGINTVKLSDWDRTKRDLVVDATGSKDGFALAVAATRPRGTVVLKSTVAERDAVDLTPLVIDEITVVGSRCGPFAPAINALARKQIEVRAMVAARYELDDGVAALSKAGERGTLKVLLQF